MFSNEFNKAALNVIMDNSEFADNINSISESFFSEDKESLELFRKMKSFVKKYGYINKKIFVEEYGDEAEQLTLFKYPDIEGYVKVNLRKIVFLSTMKNFIKNGLVDELQKDFKDVNELKLKRELEGVLSSWIEEKDAGELYYFKNPESRIIQLSNVNGIPTGFYTIDRRLLGGGLCDSELGVILAEPNRGKSAMLVHLCIMAATYGRNVLYVTLEMDKNIVAHRKDMKISGLTTPEVFENVSLVSKKIMDFQKITGSNILIKGFQSSKATVRDIRDYMLKKKRKGEFDTNLLIVDYADELISSNENQRDDLSVKEIYGDLRRLAGEFKMPVWTASQSHIMNTDDGDKKLIGFGNFTRGKVKGHIADIVISINQTDKQLTNNKATLYLLKDRNQKGGFSCEVVTEWSRMIIAENSDYSLYYLSKNSSKDL